MKQIIVHSEAELELWQAVEYYEAKCAGLGLDFEHDVRRAFSDIQDAPERWPVRRNSTRAVCSIVSHMLFTIWNFKVLSG